MKHPFFRIIVLLVGMMVFVIGWTAHAEVTIVKGSWSKVDTLYGITARARGPITFRVNKDAGTFTCTLSGSGKMDGNTTVYEVQQRIKATTTLSASSCSGTFNGESNTIAGQITIVSSYTSVASYQDGEGKTQSESHSGSQSYAANITGSVAKSGSKGRIAGDGSSSSYTITTGGTLVVLSKEEQEAYQQYVKDSVSLTKTLVGEYQKYQQGGGTQKFEDYLKQMYPDPNTFSNVEQAIRVAAIDRENTGPDSTLAQQPGTAEPALTKEKLEEDKQLTQQVMTDLSPTGADPTSAADLIGYVEQKYPDPAQQQSVLQSIKNTAMNGISQTQVAFTNMVDSFKSNVSNVTEIKNMVPGHVQTSVADKLKGKLPSAFVSGAQKFYGGVSYLTNKVGQFTGLMKAKKDWNEKNKKLFQLHKEGKLDVEGVQSLRALNLLDKTVEKLPEFGGYRDAVMKSSMGKAAKFSKNFLVYKTITKKAIKGKVTDQMLDANEQIMGKLAQFSGGAAKQKPYDDKNMFYEFFKSVNQSVNPWAPKAPVDPEKAKYH